MLRSRLPSHAANLERVPSKCSGPAVQIVGENEAYVASPECSQHEPRIWVVPAQCLIDSGFNSFLLNRAVLPGVIPRQYYFETIESVGQKAVGIWWFPPFGAGPPAVLLWGTSSASGTFWSLNLNPANGSAAPCYLKSNGMRITERLKRRLS